MALTTTKVFQRNLSANDAVFPSVDGEPRMNIEGIVEVAGSSDINVDMTSVSGAYLVGKPAAATDGDFTTAYASATTITLGGYPAGITGFTHEDIEFVRQIDNAGGAIDGTVVATYSRDDCAMDIAGNVLTVADGVFVATDTFVIGTNVPRATGGGAGGVGGGSIVYTNAADDFVATITNGTKNITITGLPFTLEPKHVVGGSIKKIAVTTDIVTDVALTDVVVAAGVITVADEGVNFATGDEVVVTLIGPDKHYDKGLDTDKVTTDNPDYAHYTDVEFIIDESNLGITATTDGGDTDTLTDGGETFTAETVAEGYTAYQVTDGEWATVDVDTLYGLAGDGGCSGAGASVETSVLTGGATWNTKVYVLPECKRFEIAAESYNFISIDVLLDSQDGNNVCYCKLYATNDDNADTTDDTYWKDISASVFGVAQLSANGILTGGRHITQGLYIIDNPTVVLKYMIKIVAENNDATVDNEFDIRIKKGY